MPVTVGINSLSVVHKGGNGVVIAFPDVCKTPSPGGPVPIPYSNGTYEIVNSAAKSPGKNITSASKINVVSSTMIGKSVGNAPLLMHLIDKAHAKGYKVMITVKAEGKAVVFLQNATHNADSSTSSNSTQSTSGSSRTYHAHSGTEGMEWLLMHMP